MGRHFFRMLRPCQCWALERRKTAQKCGNGTGRASVGCVRLKVLLALGVLLLAFAGNATFTLLSIHRARQGVVANEAYLELAGVGRRGLEVAQRLRAGAGPRDHGAPRSEPAAGAAHGAQAPRRRAGGHRPLPREGAELVAAAGLREPGGARSPRSAASSTRWRASSATAAAAVDPKARPEFESHFATLTHSLNRMRRPLRGESGQIAQRLSDDEETALSMALGAGGGRARGRGRGVRVHAAHAAAAVGAARARAAGGGRRLRAAHGRHVAATRSAIWRASSTRWRTPSRSASSA